MLNEGKLLLALLPLIEMLLKGSPIGEALGKLTMKQWNDIAVAVVKVESPDIKKVLSADPTLRKLLVDVVTESAPFHAAANARAAHTPPQPVKVKPLTGFFPWLPNFFH